MLWSPLLTNGIIFVINTLHPFGTLLWNSLSKCYYMDVCGLLSGRSWSGNILSTLDWSTNILSSLNYINIFLRLGCLYIMINYSRSQPQPLLKLVMTGSSSTVPKVKSSHFSLDWKGWENVGVLSRLTSSKIQFIQHTVGSLGAFRRCWCLCGLSACLNSSPAYCLSMSLASSLCRDKGALTSLTGYSSMDILHLRDSSLNLDYTSFFGVVLGEIISIKRFVSAWLTIPNQKMRKKLNFHLRGYLWSLPMVGTAYRFVGSFVGSRQSPKLSRL